MTNTLTITVRDKDGVNAAALFSDLGQGLYSTHGAGTELTGTQRIRMETGTLTLSDGSTTFYSSRPGVWTDMRPGGTAEWNSEAGALGLAKEGGNDFIAFGEEGTGFIAYGSETSTFIAFGNETSTFIAFGAETGLRPAARGQDNDDIFGGPSWSGIYSMDAGTLDFTTPEGDALMTTDATTLELRIAYEAIGGDIHATDLTAREDGKAVWKASYETPQALGVASGDGKGAVKTAIMGTGEPLEFGSWGEPVSTLFDDTRIVFKGNKGDDRAMGAAENDNLTLGKGNDIGLGLGGNDKINGGRGKDIVDGGAGRDKVNGQAGEDILLGGKGNDTIKGGGGRDILAGQDGNDTLNSGGGNDVVIGGAGRDRINSGAGDDLLVLGAGDTAIGNDGADTFLFIAPALSGEKSKGPTVIEADGTRSDRVIIWTDDTLAVLEALQGRSTQDVLDGNLRVESLDLTITGANGVGGIGFINPPDDPSRAQAAISIRPPDTEVFETAWDLGLIF